ncbi:MAG: ATP synthase subunit I [Mariprofundaceae bacterium]|nr:ATP synthase subunit I [Mariprofundaceae bacterium]
MGKFLMSEMDAEQRLQIRSLLLWQMYAVLLLAVVSFILGWSGWSVLVGGMVVMLSTWHVHQSVYSSAGERMLLLRAAGLRFALFLLLVGLAVVVFEAQPMMLVAGMASAYTALYVRSLLMIFEKLKGS